MGGRSERDDFFIIVVIGSRKYILFFFVKSTPKTSDKKATNGDHHAMLKVIQHGLTIAEFRSDHSRWLQINQKIATMEEGDY
jgi:hypothetical protein